MPPFALLAGVTRLLELSVEGDSDLWVCSRAWDGLANKRNTC